MSVSALRRSIMVPLLSVQTYLGAQQSTRILKRKNDGFVRQLHHVAFRVVSTTRSLNAQAHAVSSIADTNLTDPPGLVEVVAASTRAAAAELGASASLAPAPHGECC